MCSVKNYIVSVDAVIIKKMHVTFEYIKRSTLKLH